MAALHKGARTGFGISLLLGFSLTAWRWSIHAGSEATAVRRLRATFTKGENMVYSNSEYLADFQEGVSLATCKNYCTNWEAECPKVCTTRAENVSGIVCGLKWKRVAWREQGSRASRVSNELHQSCGQECAGFNFRGSSHCTLFPAGVELLEGGHGQFYWNTPPAPRPTSPPTTPTASPAPFNSTWVSFSLIVLMICCCLYYLYSTRKAVYYGFRTATSQEQNEINGFMLPLPDEPQYTFDMREAQVKVVREQYEAESARVNVENGKSLYYWAFGGGPSRDPAEYPAELGSYTPLLRPPSEVEEVIETPIPYVAPAPEPEIVAPAPEPEMTIQFMKAVAAAEPAMTIHFSKTETGERIPLVVKKSHLPLGISFHDELPIKISKVSAGTWGSLNGVEVGWYIQAVDGKEISDFMNFESAKQYIFDEIGSLGKAQLSPAGSERVSLVVKKADLPIGITFHNELPIEINKVQAGQWAARNGVEVGWNVVAIDGKEIADFNDFESAKKYIFDEIGKLGQKLKQSDTSVYA